MLHASAVWKGVRRAAIMELLRNIVACLDNSVPDGLRAGCRGSNNLVASDKDGKRIHESHESGSRTPSSVGSRHRARGERTATLLK
jgi:hypothetical protein